MGTLDGDGFDDMAHLHGNDVASGAKQGVSNSPGGFGNRTPDSSDPYTRGTDAYYKQRYGKGADLSTDWAGNPTWQPQRTNKDRKGNKG